MENLACFVCYQRLLMKLTQTGLLCFFGLFSLGQESPYAKFGNVTAEALQKKVYILDTSASAVVLSDIFKGDLQGNLKGWFSLTTSRHRVVHILNKAAYSNPNAAYNPATIEILLYTDGEKEEKLEDLKAITYNLENGKIVESKLEKSNVFTEKVDKRHILKKFTFPNVKEGSIIEYEYKVSSDFLGNVNPWFFQGYLPVLWSEFNFSVPQFYTYSFVNQGYITPFITEKRPRNQQFLIREVERPGSNYAGRNETYTINTSVTDYRMVMKDVPGLKTEKFTSTLRNHFARIECQLVSQSEPLTAKDYRSTWPALTKTLMESDYLGKGLQERDGWLTEETGKITSGATTETEKARRVFLYVRDNIVCTGNKGVYAEQSPQSTFRAKKGSIAEVNLLLTALLRNANLHASPLILSTTDHGFTVETHPLLSRFNYLVTQVQVGGKTVYLDASQNHLGFGKLLPTCYNGHARVVNEEATPVYLVADSLNERKVTALYLAKGTKSLWEGSVNQTPGYYNSYELRERIKADGQEKFFKDMQKDFGAEVKLADVRVDSLNNFDDPISLHYTISLNSEKEDVIYVNPMLNEGYKTNPFKSAERRYPVEMPYTTDETYLLSMEVPDGYELDELPKPVKAKFDAAGKTFFEYLIQNSSGIISLRSRVKIDHTLYEPAEYEGLREFFNLIVKKHNEQIVFKKKK